MINSGDMGTLVADTLPMESKWKVSPDYRPSDYIYALMSRHVYQGEALKAGDRLPDNINWEVITTQSDLCGYFGALYYNPRDHHYVMAHRGTNNLASWIEDFQGVYLGKISPQKHAVYNFVKKTVVTILESKDDQAALSFTGHSLGAFLAEVSVFYCHRSLDFARVNAVTFESPGSYETLASMQSQMSGEEIDLNQLDIIGYLSYPNLINTCNHHVGTLYQLDPHLGDWGWLSGWFTKQAHSIDGIIEIFAEESRPVMAKYLLDWPIGNQLKVFYTDAEFQEGKYSQELIDSKGQKLFKLEYQAHYSIEDTLNRSNVLPIRHCTLELQNFLVVFYQWRQDLHSAGDANSVKRKLQTIRPESVRRQLLDYSLTERKGSVKKDAVVMVRLDGENLDTIEFRRILSTWLSSKTKEDQLIALMKESIIKAPTLEIVSMLVGKDSRVNTLKNARAIAAKITIPQDASSQDIKNTKELIRQFQDHGGRLEATAFASNSTVTYAENIEVRALDIEVVRTSVAGQDGSQGVEKKVKTLPNSGISATAFSGTTQSVTNPTAIGLLKGGLNAPNSHFHFNNSILPICHAKTRNKSSRDYLDSYESELPTVSTGIKRYPSTTDDQVALIRATRTLTSRTDNSEAFFGMYKSSCTTRTQTTTLDFISTHPDFAESLHRGGYSRGERPTPRAVQRSETPMLIEVPLEGGRRKVTDARCKRNHPLVVNPTCHKRLTVSQETGYSYECPHCPPPIAGVKGHLVNTFTKSEAIFRDLRPEDKKNKIKVRSIKPKNRSHNEM